MNYNVDVSVRMALEWGQYCLGLSHTKVHLPSQQHLLLLLSLPDYHDSCGEIPCRRPSLCKVQVSWNLGLQVLLL